MRVNVGEAKTNLSKLLARVEAGEEVEIARNGVTVAKLVKAEPQTPGAWFFAMAGALEGKFEVDWDNWDFTDEELDELFYVDDLE